MVVTLHFNSRDASFRHNLSQVSIAGYSGTIVTKDRKGVPFSSMMMVGDDIVVESRMKVAMSRVDHVVVNVNG